MNIDLTLLHYQFLQKPLLIGGKAKEYYGVRKAGEDIDLVVTHEDYIKLTKQYPDNKVDLGGDLGIKIAGFEIWRTITYFNYEYLSQDAIDLPDIKIISLEKLLFLTALAMYKPKYHRDLELLVEKILKIQGEKGNGM